MKNSNKKKASLQKYQIESEKMEMKQEISNLFREIAGFQSARWSLRILKSADAAAADDGDALDVGGVKGEHPLHALAEGDLADRERARDAGSVLTADADAFVILNTGANTFSHFEADANSVACFEVGDLFPERSNLLRFDFSQKVH